MLDFFIYYAHWLKLHLLRLVAVQAVFTTTVEPAFHSSRKAGTILFITLCLFAGAEGFGVRLWQSRSNHFPVLCLDTLLAAVALKTLFVLGQIARTSLLVANFVAEAYMAQFLFGLIRETIIDGIRGKFYDSTKGVEGPIFFFFEIGARRLGGFFS